MSRSTAGSMPSLWAKVAKARAQNAWPAVWHDRPMAKGTTETLQTGPVEKIKWLDDVADHDYDAAEAYLSLKFDKEAVRKTVKHLRAAPLDDPGVMKDLIKVIEGRHLSPVLVVSAEIGADIADGYHRVSLVYRIDPYGEVPLKI